MTLNPRIGYNKVSAVFQFCYEDGMSKRLKTMGQEKYQNGFKITPHPEALKVPYTWKNPQVVFVSDPSALRRFFKKALLKQEPLTAPKMQNNKTDKNRFFRGLKLF